MRSEFPEGLDQAWETFAQSWESSDGPSHVIARRRDDSGELLSFEEGKIYSTTGVAKRLGISDISDLKRFAVRKGLLDSDHKAGPTANPGLVVFQADGGRPFWTPRGARLLAKLIVKDITDFLSSTFVKRYDTVRRNVPDSAQGAMMIINTGSCEMAAHCKDTLIKHVIILCKWLKEGDWEKIGPGEDDGLTTGDGATAPPEDIGNDDPDDGDIPPLF
jgi:hypothetical protein